MQQLGPLNRNFCFVLQKSLQNKRINAKKLNKAGIRSYFF